MAGRFINADAFANIGKGILGTSMFVYCGNEPMLYYDPTGKLYIENHPIYYNENIDRFKVDVSEDFLDPQICLYYAFELVDQKGNGLTFCGMSAERIALEIHAHAVLYYWGLEHQSPDITFGTFGLVDLVLKRFADYCVIHGEIIEVNNDEKSYRMVVYDSIWSAHISGVEKALVHYQFLSDYNKVPRPTAGPNKMSVS